MYTNLISCSYAFCIGDIGEALAHTTGYPFIYVFQNATDSIGGTTGFVSVILILLVMITISALASSSRQMFAFARDDGLPFSKWLGTVSAFFECRAHSLLTVERFTRSAHASMCRPMLSSRRLCSCVSSRSSILAALSPSMQCCHLPPMQYVCPNQ
jgi:hypothetical protein